MNKTALDKPVLVCLYGVPGSGKSYIARSLADSIQMANVSADRIRGELFQNPRYDARENAVIVHLMNYMTEEFLNAGVSVVYDINAARAGQRKSLRELARRNHADYLLVWIQVDNESAFARTQKRDRRTADDRFAQAHTQESFTAEISEMQDPRAEDYVVVSGKHSFATQKSVIINRLYQRGTVSSETMMQNITKPGLVNLVPPAPSEPTEDSPRNIYIR